MRRAFVSALLASAFAVPAGTISAGPLQLTPAGYTASANGEASAQPVAAQPERYGGATQQPRLGGGFIEFLFGNAAREPAVPRAYQPNPDEQNYARSYRQAEPDYGPQQQPEPQQTALYNTATPNYAPSSQGDMAHPPVDPKYDRQEVDYRGPEKPGTVVIDTPNHFLYLVEDNGQAMRYGIGVGRPGFTWQGVKTISAKKEWPDWYPPVEMIQRRPDLPRWMAGGPENPLGARAMYLGSSLYRIHGSNEPWTIGSNVSSGCIRLRNADVIDLYGRVQVGTKVVVM
jgi:lipoprotein-anchoring transpeptidase ErfK/SrfK